MHANMMMMMPSYSSTQLISQHNAQLQSTQLISQHNAQLQSIQF